MQELVERIDVIAKKDGDVLINGETGSGKEVIVNEIHKRSNRSNEELIAVDCGRMPEHLIESELFGHEKGAFTGAVESKKGKFEIADGGTLFLDEIGELPMELQAKLLRVLQERRFYRVGGTKVIEVNVRVLSATNRDLKKDSNEGRFREDLYYRLDKLRINIPPLRERRDDIPELVRFFVNKYRSKRNVEVTDEFIEVLMRHNWPGNVRELRNTIERAMCYVHNGKLTKESLQDENWDVMPEGRLKKEGSSFKELMLNMEKKIILEALRLNGNNQTKAAEVLGLPESTLRLKMRKLGISVK
jgi:transcriptional regulator with PAS, ATPase and Fis domain